MKHELMGLGYKVRRIYHKIRRPLTLGSRALVIRDRQVLLVRLTYQRGWFLPGGGVDRGETFVQAIRRELEEECGIHMEESRLLGVYLNRREGKVDHVAIYVVEKFRGEPRNNDPREIAEVRFFAIDDLPADLWPGHRRRVEEYIGLRKIEELW